MVSVAVKEKTTKDEEISGVMLAAGLGERFRMLKTVSRKVVIICRLALFDPRK